MEDMNIRRGVAHSEKSAAYMADGYARAKGAPGVCLAQPIGASNLARTLAADASALFARNLFNFLSAFWDKDQARPVLPDDDEIVKAIRLTRGGKVVNERLAAG